MTDGTRSVGGHCRQRTGVGFGQQTQTHSLGLGRRAQVVCLTNASRAGGECDAKYQGCPRTSKEMPGSPTVVHSTQTNVRENHAWSHSKTHSVRCNYRQVVHK